MPGGCAAIFCLHLGFTLEADHDYRIWRAGMGLDD